MIPLKIGEVKNMADPTRASTSYVASAPFDLNALSTIRRLLWKNEKMCSFVRRRTPHLFAIVQRSMPSYTLEGTCPLTFYLNHFLPKPEVFLADALQAHSSRNERRLAALVNQIFMSFRNIALFKPSFENSLDFQHIISELIDLLHVEPKGQEHCLDQEVNCKAFTNATSAAIEKIPTREALSLLQQAKKQKNTKFAEALSDALFTRMQKEATVDPQLENELLEVLYGPVKLPICQPLTEKEGTQGQPCCSSRVLRQKDYTASWQPLQSVRYIERSSIPSSVQDSFSEKATKLIEFMHAELDSNPPKVAVLEQVMRELDRSEPLSRVIKTLDPQVVQDVRELLLAVQQSLTPNLC